MQDLNASMFRTFADLLALLTLAYEEAKAQVNAQRILQQV